MAETAEAYLADQGSDFGVEILTGATLPELEEKLAVGIPVVIWLTTDYKMPRYYSTFSWILPDGSQYIPHRGLHCLVLTAADENMCRLADPLQGICEVERQQFEEVYSAMGSRALILIRDQNIIDQNNYGQDSNIVD